MASHARVRHLIGWVSNLDMLQIFQVVVQTSTTLLRQLYLSCKY